MVPNVVACIWKWGSGIFKRFSLSVINQLSEYPPEVSAIFVPQFHTQSRKAYQHVTEHCVPSELLLTQPTKSRHRCIVRFVPHTQTAALELLLYMELKNYQHKLTGEHSGSVENVSFSVAFFFELGARCFLNLKVAGWRAERQNKKVSNPRCLEAQ